MDSSFSYTMCAAATSFVALLVTLFFMFYEKFRFREGNQKEDSTISSLSPPPSLLPRNWIHDVFTSFHGADVRKSFLSHFLKECKSKGIDPFIDNEITRGEFIGPELKKAIRGSRIAIVLLSKKYASSSWCLDELVEIMECNENLAYTVMAVFYEVDPSDVKKQAGDFGKVFKKTCQGKTKEKIETWRKALAEVATIAGYHSINSENDVELIEKVVTEVSDKLFSSTRSRDFDGFVGIEAHMEKMEQVLDLGPTGVDEMKMIGIWGPPGIGKTTIARCVFKEHSGSFDLSVFMTNVKAMYRAPVCSDDYDSKLDLQQKFLSQITNQKEGFEITHLGAAQERLHDKRVLVVLDNVDQLVQLEALAKEACWFGRGSRIIVTTQDQNLLRAHGINHIYKVGFPTNSLEIFCMYAFKQKSPAAGFEKLAWEVTILAGQLPLGLRVIGCSFRGKSKQQWEDALPSLRTSLDGEIESILKFSYDALSEREKDLFLHIACFFNSGSAESLEDYLGKTFSEFRQVVGSLTDKSLISVTPRTDGSQMIEINSLLVKLGREIVRKKYSSKPQKYSIRKPRKRQYLCDASDICEVLSVDTTDSSSVIGVDLNLSNKDDELILSGRAFERMTNLEFLRIGSNDDCDRFYCPQILNSISRNLRLLIWPKFPMPCLPTNFDPKFLGTLRMEESKLEKLWTRRKPLGNLKEMDLRGSKNLKELPDLSTATKLKSLHLDDCSSLVELPFSIGNATSLHSLYLNNCSSLVKLPSSIVNLTNLMGLRLNNCSSLEELPSSIENVTNLEELILDDSLDETQLVSFPQLPDSILFIDAKNCGSLEKLNCTFRNPDICLDFLNCFKLNQEARDLIIQASIRSASVFPGGEVPAYFGDRATGSTVSVKLNESSPHKPLRFKACIALGDLVDNSYNPNATCHFYTSYTFKDKQNSLTVPCIPQYHKLPPARSESVPGHLYTFEFEVYNVTSDELIFEIEASLWVIKECGLRQLS